jgi:hypothetical protein
MNTINLAYGSTDTFAQAIACMKAILKDLVFSYHHSFHREHSAH